jgi:hypothetical protein
LLAFWLSSIYNIKPSKVNKRKIKRNNIGVGTDIPNTKTYTDIRLLWVPWPAK